MEEKVENNVTFYVDTPIIILKDKEYTDVVNYKHHTVIKDDYIQDIIEFEMPVYYSEFEKIEGDTLKIKTKIYRGNITEGATHYDYKYEYYTIEGSQLYIPEVCGKNDAAFTRYRVYVDNTTRWDWAECSDNKKEMEEQHENI